MIALNQHIDHTFLKPMATPEDIVKLCAEAKQFNFYGVCVSSSYVYLANKELKGSDIKVIATVGFPLGSSSTKSKVSEAKRAIKDGADEIDMVMNIGFLKSDLLKSVKEDIEAVKKAIDDRVLKVIIETCYLTDEEKKLASLITKKAGADFVKTSTGFGTAGATFSDVQFIKTIVGDDLKIKASGGISTAEDAKKYIALGADRIGSSRGVEMMLSE